MTVSLTGDVTDSTTTDLNGEYSFPAVDHGTSYTVTPTLAGYVFTPASLSGTLTEDTDRNFSAAALRTISGNITIGGSPLQGVVVQLSGGSSGFTSTDVNGDYTFANIPDGTAYTLTPSKTGYIFTPVSSSGTVSGNIVQDFTADFSHHVISGTIQYQGSGLSGVTVTLTGDVSDATTTDANGNYSFSSIDYNTGYTVTPTRTGYEFSPVSSSGTVNGDKDHDFTALAVYSISGTITQGGSPLSGATVTLSGDVSGSTTTDGSGNYSFTGIDEGSNYAVTPSKSGSTFSPVSASGTLNANADHDFTATLNTYTISGTVTEGGSPLAGVTITLSGGVSDSDTTDASGNYSFIGINYGTSYTVTPTFTDHFFLPLSAGGTLTAAAAHNFTASETVGDTKKQNAFLHGTQTTAPGTPSNLNQTTAYALKWGSGSFDGAYFSHSTSSNSERLIIKNAGDYLVSVTVPVTGTVSHGAVQLEVYKNGTVVPGTIGESAYLRNASGHSESSSHVAVLLESLAVDDYLEVKVKGTAGTGTITVSGQASLYAEKVEATRNVFAATANGLSSGSNLNVATFPELTWTEGREDTGITHSDAVNPEDITLDAAGSYLVLVNLPLNSSNTSVSSKVHVRLDGSTVAGGEAKQGFISNASGHNDSSVHWAGVVTSAGANQVLSIATEQEAASGTVTLQSW